MEHALRDADFLSLASTANLLQTTPIVVRKLRDTGILSPLTLDLSSEIFRTQQVVDLLERPRLDPLNPPIPRTFVVRLSSPQQESSPHWRSYSGWSESFPEQQKRDCARMFWPVRNPEALIGSPLVAQVGPINVGVWTITGWVRDRADTVFTLGDPTSAMTAAYANTFMELGRGPTSKVIG